MASAKAPAAPTSPGPPTGGPGAVHGYNAKRDSLAQDVLDEAGLPNTLATELTDQIQATTDDFIATKTGITPAFLLSRPT